MDQQSVFFEEWMRSLREQYKYVVRSQDRVTLPSLTAVLHQVGFTDDELAKLRLEATMHVDDVGADYVADMNILAAAQTHPAECSCPACLPIDESRFDDEGQPLAANAPAPADVESGHIFPAAQWEGDETGESPTAEHTAEEEQLDEAADEAEAPPDPDRPQQRSMF